MPQSYLYIRAWEEMMGSHADYRKNRIERAKETKAPQDAIYERHNDQGPTGHWATFSDIRDVLTQADIQRRVDRLKKQTP